jgi:transcriptional regulator with XRE-family HTH domain
MPVSVAPVDPQKVVGRNVAETRLSLEMTQEDLAHTAGMHPVEVSRLERGVRDLRLSTIVKVAGGLGVPPMDLLRDL